MTEFCLERAMDNLGINRMPFDPKKLNTARGYSILHNVAVSPTERWPELVALHEMAHVVMGHTTLGERHGYNIKTAMWKAMHHDLLEAECHMVAMTAAVMAGIEFDIAAEMAHLGCYTQGRDMPQSSIQRVAKVAAQIVEAGKDREKVAA